MLVSVFDINKHLINWLSGGWSRLVYCGSCLSSDESEKLLGIGRRQQFQINQLLAAILHLRNLVFVDDPTKPHDPCTIKNINVLEVAAELLGVLPPNLEITLKLIHKETCTIYLNATEAANHRDALCMTLYQTSLDELFSALSNSQNWGVLCVKPTNDASDTQFDSRKDRVQLLSHKIAEITHAKLGHN